MDPRRTWQEQLAIIDRTMRAISSVTDPEKLVEVYWQGIGDLVPFEDYLSLSRRGVESPSYLVTRSSRFQEHPNPWTQRHKLPLLSGGLAAEVVYANRPMIIEDLPSRLSADDPAHFYLQGFATAVALPQYDNGESINCTMLLFPPGVPVDYERLTLMHWHGGLFGRTTQNLVLRNQLTEALAALDTELQAVGEIQRALLPSQLPEIPGFEVSSFYQSSARAGGDYYDIFPTEDGRWGIFIADVSGHGTPAAVLMAIVRTLAHSLHDSHNNPVEFLQRLNARLCRSYTLQGAFTTAYYGILDPDSRELIYSVAGHNPPRLVRDGRAMDLSENSELPLGINEFQRYRRARAALMPGDLLLLYTDGITEAMPLAVGPAPRELFGLHRLDAALLAAQGASPEATLQAIRARVADHCKSAPPSDDQTMLALRCLAPRN